MRSVLCLFVCALLTAAPAPRALVSADEDKEWEARLKEFDLLCEKEPWAIANKERIEVLRGKLARADRLELLRLDPRELDVKGKRERASFHGYAILSQVPLTHAEQQKEVTAFLAKALHWNDGRQALCFGPRHGLRVVQGRRTTDFLICFRCDRIDVYVGGKFTNSLALSLPESNPLEQTLRKLETAKKAR